LSIMTLFMSYMPILFNAELGHSVFITNNKSQKGDGYEKQYEF